MNEDFRTEPIKPNPVATFLPNAIGRFKAMLDNSGQALTQHQVDKARDLLRVLLGSTITLHPTANGAECYLTAEISGDYAGLLRLVTGQNNVGGGEGIQPSLTPMLGFKIQGVAFAA